MKLTSKQLKEIIKEELQGTLKEWGYTSSGWMYDPDFVEQPEIKDPWIKLKNLDEGEAMTDAEADAQIRFVDSILEPWIIEFTLGDDSMKEETIIRNELEQAYNYFMGKPKTYRVSDLLMSIYNNLAKKLHPREYNRR